MTQMEVIKRELQEHIGKRVILKANKGRKKIVTKRGVLEAVYPSLFIVNVKSEGSYHRNISFTYSDVLTSTVQITVIDDDVILDRDKSLKIS